METCKERSTLEQLRDKVRRGEPLTEEDRNKAFDWHREHYADEHRRYYNWVWALIALGVLDYVTFGTAVTCFILCSLPSNTVSLPVGFGATIAFIVLFGLTIQAYRAHMKVHPTRRIDDPDH